MLLCYILDVYIYIYIYQGSPHIVKTGRLDFSLSWLNGEVRENLGDFWKSHVPLPFTKRMCLHNDLKKDAINEFGIKYWTSNPVWVKFQEHEITWILKKKYDYWWKKDWQGFAFWQKLGDFIETKAKKSPTLPGLVSPDIYIRYIVKNLSITTIWKLKIRHIYHRDIVNMSLDNS